MAQLKSSSTAERFRISIWAVLSVRTGRYFSEPVRKAVTSQIVQGVIYSSEVLIIFLGAPFVVGGLL